MINEFKTIVITFSIFLYREAQLDKKILSGLLKGTGMELKHQLYLSMIWDRIDIAEEKIFANGKCSLHASFLFVCFKKLLFLDYEYDHSRFLLSDSLQLATGQEASDIMLKAILFQRKEFIDLLIMNGFLMQSFLTIKNLRILYQEGVSSNTEKITDAP